MTLPIPLIPKHVNLDECTHCEMILDRYPGFYQPLRDWFLAFRRRHPEAHISCAGRGYIEQENAFMHKVSKAHYGQSAHNYNAALDIFEMRAGDPNIYTKEWFDRVLRPEVEPWMEWYGRFGSRFHELPHVEVRQWHALVQAGALKLVEEFGKLMPIRADT